MKSREQFDQAEALFRDMGVSSWTAYMRGLRGREGFANPADNRGQVSPMCKELNIPIRDGGLPGSFRGRDLRRRSVPVLVKFLARPHPAEPVGADLRYRDQCW